jgi:ketosteroid isomerase-like protein
MSGGGPTPSESATRELIARYITAIHEQDLDTIAACQHPDFAETYPQSGERIRGSANFRAIMENYPGGLQGDAELSADRVIGGEDRWIISPTFTMVRVSAEGDAHTAILKLRYADGSKWFMVAIVELRDGLIARVTSFFAPVFEPPEWRRQWVELVGD